MKILIVEDSERLGEMLVERLEKRGHAVMLATDAPSALDSAKASQPDVILLESELHGGEPWAVARSLKFDDHTREIPVIGLAATVSDETRAAALQNGCRDVHGKPVDFGKLLAQIEAAAPTAQGEEAAS